MKRLCYHTEEEESLEHCVATMLMRNAYHLQKAAAVLPTSVNNGVTVVTSTAVVTLIVDALHRDVMYVLCIDAFLSAATDEDVDVVVTVSAPS